MSKAQQVEFLLAGVRDTNGNPLASGKVYAYSAGTTNAKALYSAADKGSSNTQPAILDSNGRILAWADGSYKFKIYDTNDVLLYTFDNLVYGYDDGQLIWGGTSAGTGNAQTVSIAAITAYANGQRIIFIAGNTNSGSVTLNVSGIGAVTIKRIDGVTNLSAGEITAGSVIDVVYDTSSGGVFRMMNSPTFALDFLKHINGGTSTGSSNTYEITTSPVIASYQEGMTVSFKTHQKNTSTTPTLNVCSVGAVTIKRPDGTALGGGDVRSGETYLMKYTAADGGGFLMLEREYGWVVGSQDLTTDITTTSTSYEDYQDSDVAVVTTANSILLILASVAVSASNVGDKLSVRVTEDGVAIASLPSVYVEHTAGVGGENSMMHFHVIVTPGSVGGHHYKIQWKTSAHTGYSSFARLTVIDAARTP